VDGAGGWRPRHDRLVARVAVPEMAATGAIYCAMAPRTRPTPQVVRLSPKDEADLRAVLAELDRGESVELTADELRQLEETGEWPERLD
jgi:hypothetical protein